MRDFAGGRDAVRLLCRSTKRVVDYVLEVARCDVVLLSDSVAVGYVGCPIFDIHDTATACGVGVGRAVGAISLDCVEIRTEDC